MKLVLATPLYPPEGGGPATHTRFLEQHLPALGIETQVVAFSRVRSRPKGVRHLWYAWLVYRAAKESGVVFAQDTVSVGFPALLAARLARVPFVVRVPGDHAWEQARVRYGVDDSLEAFQRTRYGFRIELLRQISRLTVRHADRVVVPSHYFESVVRGWLTNPDRLRVIYNGIEPVETIAHTTHVEPGHPYMVSVGRLVPWKGFAALIDVLEALPTWSLVLVGQGPLEHELKARARQRGVAERVRFIGNAPRDEVLRWYAAADCFVLNTSWESFSYQTVEAMASGVPVVATRVCSLPELIHDGVEGVLVEPDNLSELARAIASVKSEEEVWRSRVDAAKKKAVQFGAERTAAAIGALVQEVARP
jgi:glycosyltransferase involved in cell wall biosynthesis